jgi:uncharacterized protein
MKSHQSANDGITMTTYFCKLNAPRPQFAFTMTGDEQNLMMQHAGYWQQLRSKGQVKAFGLVADPADPYGIGIVEFEDANALEHFLANDPVILANKGFRFDHFPMPLGA